MTEELAAITAFIEARLAEDKSSAELGGEGVIAWLSYQHADGQMFYTTVAHGPSDWDDADTSGVWIADGHPLPEPASVLVIWNQARELRDIEAKRAILRRCAARVNELDQYPNGLVSPRALLARQNLMDLAAVWSDHPDWATVTDPEATAATSQAAERRPDEWRPAPDVQCLACRTAGNVDARPEYGISPYSVRPISPDGIVTMYPTGRTVYYCTACRAEWIDPPR